MTCTKCDGKGRYCSGLNGPVVACKCVERVVNPVAIAGQLQGENVRQAIVRMFGSAVECSCGRINLPNQMFCDVCHKSLSGCLIGRA